MDRLLAIAAAVPVAAHGSLHVRAALRGHVEQAADRGAQGAVGEVLLGKGGRYIRSLMNFACRSTSSIAPRRFG